MTQRHDRDERMAVPLDAEQEPPEYSVVLTSEGGGEPIVVALVGADRRTAEAFTAELRDTVASARDVGAPLITAVVPGGEDLNIDPRTIVGVDLHEN
jgi:hypothetical protein